MTAFDWPIGLRAAADAFVVVGVMAVFGAFNAVASHDELVRAAPRAAMSTAESSRFPPHKLAYPLYASPRRFFQTSGAKARSPQCGE